MSSEKTVPFREAEPGDFVMRMMAGVLPCPLRVSQLTSERVICGDWEFDRVTGAEIDDFLGWGPPPLMTGSFLL